MWAVKRYPRLSAQANARIAARAASHPIPLNDIIRQMEKERSDLPQADLREEIERVRATYATWRRQ